LFICEVIFVLVSVLVAQKSAMAQDIEPQFVYNRSGYYLFDYVDDMQPKYSSAEEAVLAYQQSEIRYWSMAGFPATPIFSATRCGFDSGTTNGKCNRIEFDMNLVTSAGTSVPDVRSVSIEEMFCPIGYDKIINDTETGVSTFCTPIQPEPACACQDEHLPNLLRYLEWVGNPINPSTGVKLQSELDYVGDGSNNLKFVRTYRSDRRGWAHNYLSFGINLANPPSNYLISEHACIVEKGFDNNPHCFHYTPSTRPNDFLVRRGGGPVIRFGSANDFSPSTNINDRLTAVLANGAVVGWDVYNSSSESVERYNMLGRLESVHDRAGRATSYTYSDSATPNAIAPAPGLLIRVSDQFNHQLNFTYDAKSQMQQMTDPEGNIYRYAYDEGTSITQTPGKQWGNLTSVVFPDGKLRRYWYNEQDKTDGADLPFALTGITDENGVRFATFTYDSNGLALSSEHAGGVNRYTATHDNQSSSVITDPLGRVLTLNFETAFGRSRSVSATQQSNSGEILMTGVAYDTNNNVYGSVDFNGIYTTYTYDLTRNLETSRVEAVGKPEARTITTGWHPSYRLPAQVAEPKQLTTFNYDTKGNLLTKTVQATTDLSGALGLKAVVSGTARKWTYTYTTLGQILTIDGPRTDIADVTTYTYDTSGNVNTVSNALKKVTTLSNYDNHGRVGRVVDPNGLITELTYYPRGWLKDLTVTDGPALEITHYDYDSVGQLTKVTLPDGAFLSYTYDDAHRLTDIYDSLGDNIHYTLDSMGNRVLEQNKDRNGILARQIKREFDTLNQLKKITGGVQ
jgi:YD repeat-containing protein